jgi:hypothetical protein
VRDGISSQPNENRVETSATLPKRLLHQLFWGDVVLVVWLFRKASLATKHKSARLCPRGISQYSAIANRVITSLPYRTRWSRHYPMSNHKRTSLPTAVGLSYCSSDNCSRSDPERPAENPDSHALCTNRRLFLFSHICRTLIFLLTFSFLHILTFLAWCYILCLLKGLH